MRSTVQMAIKPVLAAPTSTALQENLRRSLLDPVGNQAVMKIGGPAAMNVPRLLTVRLAPQFTMELDALRRDGWEVCPADSARDEFDDQSVHVIVSDGDQPVGMVRVTLGGRSVLGTWSRDRVPLPHGPDVAELTRAVVAEPVRRLGIYRLAMLETVLSLRALGARLATAAIEPDFPGRRFLLELGFLAVGAPVVFDDLPRSRTLAQPIVLTLDARGECRWEAMRRVQHQRLLAAGCVVESEPLASRRFSHVPAWSAS